MNHRNITIDIAKGLGIMLVVLGHQYDFFGADIKGVFKFVCLFHVPLFFFLSGIFYREAESFVVCLKKKFIRLYVPYLLANIFFFAVEMIRAKVLGSDYDGSLSWTNLITASVGFGPVLSMFCRPTWFLLVLFRISLLYKLIQLFTHNRKWLMFWGSVVAGVLGASFVNDSYLIGQTMVALPFFSLGHILNIRFVENHYLFDKPSKCIIFLIVSVPLLYVISIHQSTIMALNKYGNLFLMFSGALLGIMTVIWVSKLIELLPKFSAFMTFIGRYTLSILIWHMFLMKVVVTMLEYVGLFDGPLNNVAAFIVGIIGPCLLSMIWTKFKNRIWSR